jgi:protoporphyrin/coproporphyrin ferrochelatase
MTPGHAPFDAVLVVAFGGPLGPADIRPFLANVLRGRRVPADRIEEVARHYEEFGGVSPLTAITRRQVDGLRARLAAAGVDVPVYLGMRNWHPLLPDIVQAMARDGVRRAIGFICAAHRSYSSCTQYRQNVTDARAETVAAGLADVSVTYVDDWHAHEGFIDANARHVRAALDALAVTQRERARIVFTAHSIPVTMAGADRYRAQLMTSAGLVARRLGTQDWALVFQSRSGRPEDPWLGPDVCDYLRAERAAGLDAAVLCPLGFLCDHVEVLHDLDRDAAQACRDVGLAMTRAEAVNDDPLFLDTMADVVLRTWHRYASGLPLPLAPASAPARVEGPPPFR